MLGGEASPPPSRRRHSIRSIVFVGLALFLGLMLFLKRDERLVSWTTIYSTTQEEYSSNEMLSPTVPPTSHPTSQNPTSHRSTYASPTLSPTPHPTSRPTRATLHPTLSHSPTQAPTDDYASVEDDEKNNRTMTNDMIYLEQYNRSRQVCKLEDTTMQLFFPHVNKAGGRSLEGTFEFPSHNAQFRFLPQEKRSFRFAFELQNGHRDFNQLMKHGNHFKPRDGVCMRWIFMMRDPLARTLSAFYTNVGREPVQSSVPTTATTDHFTCTSPLIQRLMLNESFTFEDFAALPKEERATCYEKTGDMHVRYLSPKRDIRMAKRRVRDMAFLGIAEDFALSIELMNWELDLHLNLYTPIFNKNVYPTGNLSAQALQALRELNELDIEFYSFAKANVFDARVRAMREYQKKAEPWDVPRKFVCGKEIICWDKRNQGQRTKNVSSEFWDYELDEPPAGHFTSAGEMKSNTLCGMKRGCRAEPPYLAPKPCLASFFILGARKGGTTSMYLYLAQHPQVRAIAMEQGAQAGEALYFEKPTTRINAKTPVAVVRDKYNRIYTSQFTKQGQHFDPQVHVTGESSVGSSSGCQVPPMLRETCGSDGIKLVYILRNPVERMISQHQMRYRLGTRQSRSVDFALDAMFALKRFRAHPDYPALLEWLAVGDLDTEPPCLFPHDFRNPDPLWGGLYVVHIARWLQYFSPDQMLILQSEQFFKHPAQDFQRALDFLHLDSTLLDVGNVTKQVFNQDTSGMQPDGHRPNLNATVLHELNEFFRPFNDKLTWYLANKLNVTHFGKWKEY